MPPSARAQEPPPAPGETPAETDAPVAVDLQDVVNAIYARLDDLAFRVGEIEARVATIQANVTLPVPRESKPATPLCDECGMALPMHFDQCSHYEKKSA